MIGISVLCWDRRREWERRDIEIREVGRNEVLNTYMMIGGERGTLR